MLVLLILACCAVVCYKYNTVSGTRDDDVENPTEASAFIPTTLQPTLPLEGQVTVVGTDLENECAICLELFDAGQQVRLLDCGHYYHLKCVDPWLRTGKKCPKCNGRARARARVKNIFADINASTA